MIIKNGVLQQIFESDIQNGCVTLPESLTHIGGWAFDGCTSLTEMIFKKFKMNEKRRVLCVDGIVSFIKKQRHFKGEVEIYECEAFAGMRNRKPILSKCYIAERSGTYAHGKTVKSALSDLRFKMASERGAEQYARIDLDKQMPFEEATAMYRIITGACQFGTEEFISRLKTVKESYSANEIIDLTQGQYGHSAFVAFFRNAGGV